MTSSYQNYVNHFIMLTMGLNKHLVNDVTKIILNLYHKQTFLNIKHWRDIEPELIDYHLQKKYNKITVYIKNNFIWPYIYFCRNNGIQLIGNGHTHFDGVRFSFIKISDITLSNPMIKINSNVKFIDLC